MPYLRRKGCRQRGHQEKAAEEVYLTVAQVQMMLDAIEKTAAKNAHWRRDHALIFCGFYFGLRIGEACALTRQTFRGLGKGAVYIHTLKNRKKNYNPETKLSELSPPVVELHVREYVADYLASLPKRQSDLFVGRNGSRLTTRMAAIIFDTYAAAAGLGPAYSWHALRHGRGVQLWERFKDQKLVQLMLRHSNMATAQIYIGMSPATLAQYRAELEKDGYDNGVSETRKTASTTDRG